MGKYLVLATCYKILTVIRTLKQSFDFLVVNRKFSIQYCCTHRKLENHLTSCAVLFLLNLMSGKYILRMDEDGYLTQKNISFAFLRCIGVSIDEFTVVKEISLLLVEIISTINTFQHV